MLLRSLDTINTIVGPRTRLILRTDAAPFNVLVQGPPIDFTAKAVPAAPPPGAAPPKDDKLDDGAASVMGLLDPRHGADSP
jgi:hypothetical protein